VAPAELKRLSTPGVLYFPGPNLGLLAWQRSVVGHGCYSLCGVTHTTCSAAVMQGLAQLLTAPVQPWDAVICTSRAVQSAVKVQFDLTDQHVRAHFGANPPPRPMLPVIPLGVHCEDFRPEAAAGISLRERLGATPQDVVFTTIARLTPHEKFDPFPIYTALQRVQRQLTGGQRLHLVFCGVFSDAYGRRVFETGAAKLMPDVNFMILDGSKAEERKAALSGADVFLFLIDNIQETFGLAPIEAMAAGLPLLVSDWDGMKDTVSPDVGLRVTTRTLTPRHTSEEALRHHGGVDNYTQYCASVSAVTEIDMEELQAKIMTLVQNPELRRSLGAAGKKRADALYDWSRIIPQMQDLWAEQDRRRRVNAARFRRYAAESLPLAPAPTKLFASYPTEQTAHDGKRFVAVARDGLPNLNDTLVARDYLGTKRIFAAPRDIGAVYQAVQSAEGAGLDVPALLALTGLQRNNVDRIVMWLLKYGFLRRV
jgi:glycosyltransferase involved in cell wall biosynthesis